MEITRKPCEERGAETRPAGPMGSNPPPPVPFPTAAPTAVFPLPTAPAHCSPLLHVHCPNPSPLFSFPHPIMCLFLCPIPTVHTALSPPTASFLLPQHVAPPTASTSTAQSHALLRNYWLSLLLLTAARTASTPLTRPTAPPTLPSPTPHSRGHSHRFHRWAA